MDGMISKADITDWMRLAMHRAPALRQPITRNSKAVASLPSQESQSVAKQGEDSLTLKTKSDGHGKPRRAITMNKTEREYFEQLKLSFPNCDVRWEAYTLRLANRATYTPDFAVISCSGEIDFYEVKGAYIYPKALVKLRIAAEMFPHRFYLAQKKKHNWTVTDIPKRS